GVSADQRLAVERSFTKVAPVMIVAASIASLSFSSLLTFETAAIRNFGLFTALGILSALAIEMTLTPAVRCLLPAPTLRERTREGTHHFFDPIIASLRSFTRGRRRTGVVAVAALVTSAAALAGSRVVVDSSFRQQFFRNSVVRRDDRALNAAFAGTSTLVLLIEGDREGAIED